jgi:uncharacterized protein involved in exopolysaccharide biosynthesis
VTYTELIRSIFLRLSRLKFLILAIGIVLAALLFFYGKSISPVYSSKATIFPLNATNDNTGATSALTSMLGLSEAPKSFSQEASINIIELAQSRNTREAVAMERLPDLGNKTIAELMIEDHNKHKSMFASSIKVPEDKAALAAIGGNLLKAGFFSKINKNGILEINFSATDQRLISPVSYKFVDKISEFYKDLKIRKAKLDYEFTEGKIDSLDKVLNTYDKRAVRMANTTLFVTPDKIEYQIPKENLVNEKDRVLRQRDASTNNREEALWRLQKVTPIIAILDKPDPPFDVKKPSSILFAGIGFLLGCILAAVLSISGILYRYAKAEAKKAIFSSEKDEHVNVA